MKIKSIEDRAKLSDGNSIPWFGLGVFRSPAGSQTIETVKTALEAGYRHIDTAAIYGNEADVGTGIHESGIPREKIFVTTKLWNQDQGFESTLKAFERSLKLLKLDFLDLYLLHWPVPELRLESWKALIKLRTEGRVKSIGVSNFMERHLQELFEYSGEKPVINQVEMSPFLSQKKLQEFCAKNGILLEAYSPLTKGLKLTHPDILKVAEKHGKSAAQIMIRWALETGAVTIPKSNKPKRIIENSQVFDFELDRDDHQILDTLNEDLHTGWDPTDED